MNFEVRKGSSVLATYHFTAAGKYSTTASMPYGVYTNGDARVEFSGAGKALFEGSVLDIASMGSNQYYGSYSASVRKVFTLNDADKEFTVADRTIVVYLDLNYAGAPQPEELIFLIRGSALDGVALATVILLGFGGLLFVSYEGFFDIFAYGFKQLFTSRFSKKANENNDFPGYKVDKRTKREAAPKIFLSVLAAGVLFLIALIVLKIVFFTL